MADFPNEVLKRFEHQDDELFWKRQVWNEPDEDDEDEAPDNQPPDDDDDIPF
jgi:hypothetical protein